MPSAKPSTSAEADDLYLAGLDLLLGMMGTPEPEQAVEAFRAAQAAGSPAAAARLAVLAGVGLGRDQSWSDSLDLLEAAAVLGDRSAQRQLALLTSDVAVTARIRTSTTHGPAVWAKARAGVDIDAWIRPPTGKVGSDAPRIVTFERFATPEVCRWLMRRGEGAMEPAMVNDPATGQPRTDPMRTNGVARIGLADTDVVVLLTQARISAATGLANACLETPNLLCYAPGQQYRPHHDFFNPAAGGFADEIAILGQRVATFLIYLNDDYTGGETDFPSVGQRYRGGTGDALLFVNVRPDGSPDPDTLHAGLPPARGRKWVLSQWIRDKPQAIG
ncbi:hypothetical protein GCM10009422_05610 [Brevundimonas kwangchunensis]|uniref:Fe2OG dioxygenase domain-containing protein n=1 Tax=Brevundimonas kwangchunensis TaxID=322163 RepID=A0ABN1GKN5_9CAUL